MNKLVLRPDSFARSPVEAVLIVASLVAAIVFGYSVYQRAQMSNQPPAQQSLDYPPGSQIQDSGHLALAGSSLTLVLMTSSSCHFCAESLPFYRRITPKAHSDGVRVVAITREDPDVNKNYLAASGVAVDDVLFADDDGIRVAATPTLLLLRSDGSIVNSWVGKLTAAQEKEIWSSL